MKCYEIKPMWTDRGCFDLSLKDTTYGLPIELSAEQPLVEVSGPECSFSPGASASRALLSGALAERLQAPYTDQLFTPTQIRLNSCSVDHRSEVWLGPPQDEERNDVLVLASYFGRAVDKDKHPVTFLTEGEGSKILIANEVQHINSHGLHEGLAVLAHLRSGGSLLLKTHVWVFQSKSGRSTLLRMKEDFIKPRLRIDHRFTAMQDGSLART